MSSFLDPILGWMLVIHPALAIFLISVIVSLVITLAIKYMTNQSLMKDMRNEMKDLQKEMKKLKNNPKRMSQINDRFMEINMKYMSSSMKPTLFTFIPIILVFGWLQAHIGYYPINPEMPFEYTVTFEDSARGFATLKLPDGLRILEGDSTRELLRSDLSWTLAGSEGEHTIVLEYMNATYEKKVLVTYERTYAPVEQSFKKSFLFFSSKDKNGVNKITLSNKQVIPFEDVPIMKDIPWISTWGWFGTYFLFSLISSIVFRKVFDIY
ncbi:MAG: EMC3/TMCO1 family protein [archaeon]